MKTNTKVRAGGVSLNHPTLRVKTKVRAGLALQNAVQNESR